MHKIHCSIFSSVKKNIDFSAISAVVMDHVYIECNGLTLKGK